MDIEAMDIMEDLMLKQVLLSLAFAFCTVVHGADIYKWVDDDGNTQYTATPPQLGVPFKKLHKPSAPSTDPEAAMQKLRDQAAAASQSADDGVAGDEQAAGQAGDDRKALWAKNCELAQANVEMLQSDRDVAQADESGNKVLLAGEARQKALRRAQKNVEYYCEP
jgi:hypothetical protein